MVQTFVLFSIFIIECTNHCFAARQMRKEREGRMVYQLGGHTDGINCLAVSSDDSVLVSGCEDFTARVWSIEDPEEPEEEVDLDALFEGDKDNEQNKENLKVENIETKENEDETDKGNDVEDDQKEDTHEDDDGDTEKTVETSETPRAKNEGEARCLGVLKYVLGNLFF